MSDETRDLAMTLIGLLLLCVGLDDAIRGLLGA